MSNGDSKGGSRSVSFREVLFSFVWKMTLKCNLTPLISSVSHFVLGCRYCFALVNTLLPQWDTFQHFSSIFSFSDSPVSIFLLLVCHPSKELDVRDRKGSGDLFLPEQYSAFFFSLCQASVEDRILCPLRLGAFRVAEAALRARKGEILQPEPHFTQKQGRDRFWYSACAAFTYAVFWLFESKRISFPSFGVICLGLCKHNSFKMVWFNPKMQRGANVVPITGVSACEKLKRQVGSQTEYGSTAESWLHWGSTWSGRSVSMINMPCFRQRWPTWHSHTNRSNSKHLFLRKARRIRPGFYVALWFWSCHDRDTTHISLSFWMCFLPSCEKRKVSEDFGTLERQFIECEVKQFGKASKLTASLRCDWLAARCEGRSYVGSPKPDRI